MKDKNHKDFWKLNASESKINQILSELYSFYNGKGEFSYEYGMILLNDELKYSINPKYFDQRIFIQTLKKIYDEKKITIEDFEVNYFTLFTSTKQKKVSTKTLYIPLNFIILSNKNYNIFVPNAQAEIDYGNI